MAMPAGPPAYAPAPHHGGYKIPPRPFAYAYGVSDEYSGTNFDKKETQVILISYFLTMDLDFKYDIEVFFFSLYQLFTFA